MVLQKLSDFLINMHKYIKQGYLIQYYDIRFKYIIYQHYKLIFIKFHLLILKPEDKLKLTHFSPYAIKLKVLELKPPWYSAIIYIRQPQKFKDFRHFKIFIQFRSFEKSDKLQIIRILIANRLKEMYNEEKSLKVYEKFGV